MKDFAEQTVVIANLKSEAGEKPGVTLQIVGQDDPLPFARAVQSGIVMNGIFVEANDGEIEARLRDDHRVPRWLFQTTWSSGASSLQRGPSVRVKQPRMVLEFRFCSYRLLHVAAAVAVRGALRPQHRQQPVL